MHQPAHRLPFLLIAVLAMANHAYAGSPTKWSWLRNNSGTEVHLTLTDDSFGYLTLKEVVKDPESKYPFTNGLGELMTLPHLSMEDKDERNVPAKEGLFLLKHETTIKGWDLYWKPMCSTRGEIATIPAHCTVGLRVESNMAAMYSLVMKVWGLVGPNRRKDTNTLSSCDVKFTLLGTKVVDVQDELGVLAVNLDNLGDDDSKAKNYFITINEP